MKSTPKKPAKEAQVAKAYRESLRLSQEEFAARFGLPYHSYQDVENGRRQPSTALRRWLMTIVLAPETAEHIVWQTYKSA